METLGSGKFIVTAEVSPPKGTDTTQMLRNAALLDGVADAINVTDNQCAVMRMSPLAACSILRSKGYETIMHMTCRDRNRLALQSELLGASSLGINSILVMSGDHPVKGDHKGAKPVYDLDSVQLLELVRELNRGYDFSGNTLEGKTRIFAGAVTNTELSEVALIKFRKKISSGIHFIQTQAVFDTNSFSGFMEQVYSIRSKYNPDVKIIAGIIPLKSVKSADFLNSNIAGIRVPDEIISRMQNAANPEKEGMEIAAGLISELRGLCDGVHIMPVGNHENTAKIIEMAGI
ncbi:MAG: methylenetetrahydrofolate reductase [Candidatus Methanoperedens sp.]|jgi:5,10-methylenetetrahydrofolate reductase|nr:methylenetetrahydrofolate reductase [Candidatus Methanoperedens sp.]PKL52816.1 MAG: 5,10-methylenetetrahydrofolate reductase [Candidatus Methanoperedenaceae archaeon HGW-Methanoperedenaceae-1]